jgi:ELWxxDGT repeat protein
MRAKIVGLFGLLLAVGCSSSDPSFQIGGTVTGLSGTLVLRNNGADDLTLTADGLFTFATALVNRTAYAVTVASAPNVQNCAVKSGEGTLDGGAVTAVSVVCRPKLYFVGDDGVHGTELFVTDGTSAGTTIIKDINSPL